MTQTRAIDDEGTNWLWDVVERSRGGNERRRRLMSRMTDGEAREWAAVHDAELHRVDESLPHPMRGGRASPRHQRHGTER
jgi:hypothetical protein